MSSTARNPPLVLRKAVLVSTPESDVSCLARLRIAHDENANQGSISLRITANLANLSGRSQVLTLNVPPEIVEKCALIRQSNDRLCPSRLVAVIPTPVTNVSAISTLDLQLSRTGIVLCPPEMDSISPANQGDSNYHAFAKICQSTCLRLHFARQQFVNDQLNQLEAFCRTLQKGRLQAESFDHTRHGVVQRDWRVFGLSLDPPPYCEEPVSEPVARKRRKDSWPMQPDDKRRRGSVPPPSPPLGSPTEVNTPSTFSPSPSSIRRTDFARTSSHGRTERNRLMHLEHELRGVSDDLICELLIRSGRQHLLAIPEDVHRNLSSGVEKASFGKVSMIERRLERYVDEMIERRIKSLVDEIFDRAVSECRDQMHDECKMSEAEFREQVDDGNSEVRNTANECMKEMNEVAQKHVREIEDHAQQYMNDIEFQGIEVETSAKEKLATLKRWFDVSAQSLLDSKSRPSHELGTSARRTSI